MEDLLEDQFVDDVSATWNRNDDGEVIWNIELDLSNYDVSRSVGEGEFTTTELFDKENVHTWFLKIGLRRPDYSLKTHINFVDLVLNKAKFGLGFPKIPLPDTPPNLATLRATHTLFDSIHHYTVNPKGKTHILVVEPSKLSIQPETVDWIPICGVQPNTESTGPCNPLPDTAYALEKFVEETTTMCTMCKEYLLWHLYFVHAT